MITMQKTKQDYFSKYLFPFFITITLLFFSCNSKKDSLIGGTWKLKNYKTEIKVNEQFEKIDSISEIGFLFDEISFVNDIEFNFSSKGINDAKEETSSLLGGTGLYKQINDEIILEYAMDRKSLNFTIDSTGLILVEDLRFEEPMILSSESKPEIKVKEIRNTYYFKKQD